MPFQFTCPYCFKKTLVLEELAGQKGPCVGCGKLVTVPEPPSKQPEAAAPIGSSFVPKSQLKTRSELSMLVLRTAGLTLGIAIFSALMLFGFWPTFKGLKARRDAIACMSNLQRIARALNAYASDHGTYPTPVVTDAAGKPLYSWRVLLLPYLDEQNLYANFKLNEAWDSPANAALLAQCPDVYISPGSGRNNSLSNYVLITGPGTVFPKTGPLKPAQISDGLDRTLLVVETDNLVNDWSKPFDIDISKMNARIGATGPDTIGGTHAEGAAAVFADGEPAWLSIDLPSAIVDASITPNGNEAIPFDPELFKIR
jgi:type II secretory pathway pseudopilin PulG